VAKKPTTKAPRHTLASTREQFFGELRNLTLRLREMGRDFPTLTEVGLLRGRVATLERRPMLSLAEMDAHVRFLIREELKKHDRPQVIVHEFDPEAIAAEVQRRVDEVFSAPAVLEHRPDRLGVCRGVAWGVLGGFAFWAALVLVAL
jgi:hypothetical protein